MLFCILHDCNSIKIQMEIDIFIELHLNSEDFVSSVSWIKVQLLYVLPCTSHIFFFPAALHNVAIISYLADLWLPMFLAQCSRCLKVSEHDDVMVVALANGNYHWLFHFIKCGAAGGRCFIHRILFSLLFVIFVLSLFLCRYFPLGRNAARSCSCLWRCLEEAAGLLERAHDVTDEKFTKVCICQDGA